MLELTRCVRSCISADSQETGLPVLNAFSAWPPVRGLGLYVEILLTCCGEADPVTGYFLDIRQMDQAIRSRALPIFRSALMSGCPEGVATGQLLAAALTAIQPDVNGSATCLTLRQSPHFQLSLRAHAMHTLEICQHYEFSAAHRLGVVGVGDAHNQALFGKCAHPAGHGHNYVVVVTVASPIGDDGHAAALRDPSLLDRWVKTAVLDDLDHRFLNADVPEFAAGLNPSVENIVKVVWDRLATSAPSALRLVEVAVYETEKTRCAYRGATAAL